MYTDIPQHIVDKETQVEHDLGLPPQSVALVQCGLDRYDFIFISCACVIAVQMYTIIYTTHTQCSSSVEDLFLV